MDDQLVEETTSFVPSSDVEAMKIKSLKPDAHILLGSTFKDLLKSANE